MVRGIHADALASSMTKINPLLFPCGGGGSFSFLSLRRVAGVGVSSG